MRIVLVGSSLDSNRHFTAIADSIEDLRVRIANTPWAFDADGEAVASEREIEARLMRSEAFTIFDQSNWGSQDAISLSPA